MTTKARADTRFYECTRDSSDAYETLLDAIPPGSRVLELGSGEVGQAHRLAQRGCLVTGVSSRRHEVEGARRTASERGLATANFELMNAEELTFADSSFDAVLGASVLHRLDVALAYAEMARVLRSDGQVVLLEPLGHNPIINAYRRRTPDQRVRFEHPIRREEFSLASRWFETVEVQTHHLLSLATATVGDRRMGRAARGVLERLDRVLLSNSSPLRWHGWIAVINLRGPR